jgi:hypothetical protein
LRGVVRAIAKQEDQEDDNVCVVVFVAKRNGEDNSLARRRPRKQ